MGVRLGGGKRVELSPLADALTALRRLFAARAIRPPVRSAAPEDPSMSSGAKPSRSVRSGTALPPAAAHLAGRVLDGRRMR